MVEGLTIIVLSILAVPSLILSKRPDSKELLNKIAPYQGWIGLFFCFWGIWLVILSVLDLGIIGKWPIWWATRLAVGLIEAVLGFLLGFGTISRLVLSKNEQAKQKAQQLLAALAPKQGLLGVIGIGVGIWTIIYRVVLF